MIYVCILWWEQQKGQPKVVLEKPGIKPVTGLFDSVCLSVRPPVRQSVMILCSGQISYKSLHRHPRFAVWMHLGKAKCRVQFSGHCDLDLVICPHFCSNRIWSTPPTLFEVGFQNFVWGCILGSFSFHFDGTVTLTLDLIWSITVSGAYILHYLR